MTSKKSNSHSKSASRSAKTTGKPATKSAQQSVPRSVAAKVVPPSGSRKKSTAAGFDQVAEYRHGEATRTNNPPAKIAAEGTVPLMGKIRYEYNPRLSPVLRFDPTGGPDALPELLQQAQQRKLSADETRLLAEALRNQEPWMEWANKREKRQFEVDPVALHIHERVSPQAIIRVAARQDVERSLFADPEQTYNEAVQFYRHEVPWTNRLILGDSLQVMTSLAKREDLAGKVQMIYMDPPYGIRFGSNFQSEVGKREVKDKEQDLTREPEMVKAYRDTWHLGIHSYLSYLRDRLTVTKELLAGSGSIFVQMGEENVHTVRTLLDEVFGAGNFLGQIAFVTTGGQSADKIGNVFNYLLWYAKDATLTKYQQIYFEKAIREGGGWAHSRVEFPDGSRENIGVEQVKALLGAEGKIRPYSLDGITSQGSTLSGSNPLTFQGRTFEVAANAHWKTSERGMSRLSEANRIESSENSIRYVRFLGDFPVQPITNVWDDTNRPGYIDSKRYVVQTSAKVIERCILMTTGPGDLVLDPTCGSGTTAFVAEQWGRRWITTDTSRVAIAIARQRLLTSKFDFYRLKEESQGIGGNFVYRTVPHITLKSIAQNANLDPIFAKHQPMLDATLAECNTALKKVTAPVRSALAAKLLRKQKVEGRKSITDGERRCWELPEPGKNWEHWQLPFETDPDWPQGLQDAVTKYRKAWRTKMDEVNASIAANADQEELVDQPVVVKGVTRVSGPFTVEAVQPPEMSLGEVKTLSDVGEFGGAPEELESFPPFTIQMVESRLDQEEQNLEAYLDQMIRYLKMDGVRFPNNKQMQFHRLEPVLDGSTIHAEGRWANGEKDPDPEGRANVGVVFGPQYGPVTAPQVEDVIRQASRRGYDHLVIAGFSFDGAATGTISEIKHPKVKVHQAHIRPDVNPGMEGLLKEQPGSQLFSVFGLPRIRVEGPNSENDYVVEMEGVDIYDPLKNLTVPTKADKVAAWFLDGDYDGRCFCVTQAFFPDRSAWEKLSKALTGVVDPARFEALSGTRSLPFPAGKYKCVAVKVIDPRGNEVMTVDRLEVRRGR